MTKRDKAVFDKAFAKMKAKGYFDDPQAEDKDKSIVNDKPIIIKAGKKSRKKTDASVSSQYVADRVPIAASEK
jgi:hypothetical protein